MAEWRGHLPILSAPDVPVRGSTEVPDKITATLNLSGREAILFSRAAQNERVTSNVMVKIMFEEYMKNRGLIL